MPTRHITLPHASLRRLVAHGALMLCPLSGCDGTSAARHDAGQQGPADAGLDAALDSGAPEAEAGLRAVSLDEAPLFLSAWSSPNEAGASEIWLAGGSPAVGGVIARGGDALEYAPIPPGPPLWWIWGTGDRIWAVGEGSRILTRRDGEWRREPVDLPDTAVLWGIWGSSATDLWAVGGSPRPDGPKGILLHSAGDGVWTRVMDEALPTTSNLFKTTRLRPGPTRASSTRASPMRGP